MRLTRKKPPRTFRCGHQNSIRISHVADIRLRPDEQITFITPTGKEHDFAAKSWGFYSTPSMNSRLRGQGFKTALVTNSLGRVFINVVEKKRMADFKKYLRAEKGSVLEWLDERPLKKVRKRMR